MRAQNLLVAVKLEAISAANGVPPPPNQNPPATPTARPLLSFSKPSWIVRTESNVLKERRKRPDPPCVICQGSGRVDCHNCHGKGRTNYTHLAMLPKGEWPKWCRTCGGSGLSYCSRCLGTGEYRYIMGFQFMRMDSNQCRDSERSQVLKKQEPRSPSDLLLNEQMNSSNKR